MKRYDIEVQIVREEGIEAAIAEMVTVADLHAWALKHKATVEKLPHSHGCHVYAADKAKRKCNCPRGDALREIEEIVGAAK